MWSCSLRAAVSFEASAAGVVQDVLNGLGWACEEMQLWRGILRAPVLFDASLAAAAADALTVHL